MNQTTIKNSYCFILALAFMFAACKNNSEEINLNKSTGILTSMNDDYHIDIIHDEDQERVNVYIENEFFTSYIYKDEFKKPILYPLITAHGSVVTRGFPIEPRDGEQEDHPHQVGLWLNYGDVNGLDFWNNSDARPADRKDEYGTIYHKLINRIEKGDEKGILDVTKEWATSDGEVLLTENTTYIFRENENARSIDRITNLHASGDDVSLKDNKEGMIGIRMTRELEHPDEHDEATGMYVSSEGLKGHEVWGSRAKWVNLTGRINGEYTSVAILDHPENIGYPTYWHARGYGLFAANPLGMKEMSGGKEELNFLLAAGKSITFKHRILIYSGKKTGNTTVENAWNDFVR